MGIEKMATKAAITGNGSAKAAKGKQKDSSIVIGGKEYNPICLTANQYLVYEKKKNSQSSKLANEWLTGEAFGYDFDYSKFKFRDRGKLLLPLTMADITYHDDLPLSETGDFEVEGNRFTEKENSGDGFDRFVSQYNVDKSLAIKNGAKATLLINGEEITDRHFELIAKEGGIGFKGMATIQQWLTAFL